MEDFDGRISYDKDEVEAIVNIAYKDKRLSLTGDVRENGRWSSGGQCYEEVLKNFPESARLVEIWMRWHLNDMNAGCEHQRANWNLDKIVTLSTYNMTTEAFRLKRDTEQDALKRLAEGKSVRYTPSELKIVNLPYELHDGNDPNVVAGYFKLKSEEEKSVGWLNPEKHPEGILGKPCGVCGYKYGTAWKFEEVPISVLEELKNIIKEAK